MNLKKILATKNNCYISGKKHTVKGIMVHSTGANNPELRRYVAPDDGTIGKNQYNNDFNRPKPNGVEICPHAWIGKLKDGNVATVQTLPWDMVGWHSGSGSKGYSQNANNTGYIGFEICEDNLSDKAYFNAVYKEATELCAMLCKEYSIKPTLPHIICHSEGHKLGIASNHADVMHWFSKHNKSMDSFRDDVKALLSSTVVEKPKEPSASYPEKLTTGYYRVRKTWGDKKSQIGAYRVLSNAKAQADKNAGYYVFDEGGKAIYPTNSTTTYREYTVVKGDSLWGIAQKLLGSGTRYPEILKLNGLSSNIIYSGQKLKIPN